MPAKNAFTTIALSSAVLGIGGISSAVADDGYTDDVVRIGVLTDMSGIYSDLSGEAAVTAVEMAVEDFGGEVNGVPIEVIHGDHRNEADTGASRAREWYDSEGVDMINDLSNSGVALAVAAVADERERHAIVNSSSTVDLTNEYCSPYVTHYTYDAHSLAHGTGKSIVEDGGESWFFLTVDFAFGIGLEEQVSEVVRDAGGQVVGAARHPLDTSDFSSYALQAQASNAEIIGIASTGADAINAINALAEFGVTPDQQPAALLLWYDDIDSLGLETAQELLLTNAFYWDADEDTREFSERFYERTDRMPNMAHAGNYSSTMHYLKAIEEAGSDDSAAVSEAMREMKINDFFASDGYIRPNGRMVHDQYLWKVKSPDASEYDYDYLELVTTIPGEEAFQPLEESTCHLLDDE
ncbi:ABC transporter substrate-binding protein [Aidingimonas halophila]|uniref:Amino acid/amide ABC transporter substrate-binding protein, HAAT family n=1 Tax=Aidingimonas halophila TaxID=574349 RepID=A0A1H3FGS9_9GAMM|nr:ABC transporter substrate-binding protein [Aidingimonas halophila]GHC37896.1 ABC transporter permease [Aidingimonas halophila]SDX90166.1 amino acid/amide ABC transporter substrate-binding protein, HAAT family [Aidingimonas halophila]